MPGSPTTITGSVLTSTNATLAFNPKIHNQRAALALGNGYVYICWASHNDNGPYHGWIMAYSTYTSGGSGGLQQSYVFNDTPDGKSGGIWQAGSAPAFDSAGNLYVGAGNGDWDGKTNFGQSVLKLSPTLQLLDYFTSSVWQSESDMDLDLACGGLVLLPATGMLVETSKTGTLYLLSTQNLGHMVAGNPQIPQFFIAGNGHIHSGPTYWNSPVLGPLLYIWSENDYLKAFHFNGTTLDTTPLLKSTFQDPYGMPGAMMALSANGTNLGSAILWVNMPWTGDSNHSTVPGVLRAFDANDLTKELWNSRTEPSRDDFGNFAKFSPPIIANGKVYLSTFSNQVVVYGLLAHATPGTFETLTPAALTLSPGSSGSVTANVSSSGTLASSISWSASGVPGGVRAQFDLLSVNNIGSSNVVLSADSAAAAGTYTIDIDATSGNYAASQPLTLTIAPASIPSIQIDSGGGAAGTFQADTGFSGGITANSTNTIDTSAVTNPAPAAAYQSERSGAFTYTVPNLSAGGAYTVRLHFAEFHYTSSGKRMFNVAVNGTTVLQNFDIVAAAGAANKAVVRQFNATADASGRIVISFMNGSADYAKISGIEVTPGRVAAPLVQIDSGGGAAGTFVTDAYFSGGMTAKSTNTIDTSAVTNPAPAALYQSERYGAFTYTVPNLNAGRAYTVRLHFAEFHYTSTGKRIFNVAINGTNVLQNFDIVAAAGAANKAVIEQFDATADSSGQIVLGFVNGSADYPKINGIEVIAGTLGAPLVQIDSGGFAAGTFVTDAYFSGGMTARSTNTIDRSGAANPAPVAVYQSERYGAFTFTVPNLSSGGEYTVRLHFAEFHHTTSGKRIFNVAINGTKVLQNFDIVAAAGAANKADIEQFNATANATGHIVIDFMNGTGDYAKISGIEIVPGALAITSSVQINTGGEAAGTFQADIDFSGGITAKSMNTIDTSAVANPAPVVVYQSERYGELTYTVPNLSAGGAYTVRLHFAELHSTTPGKRIFNVAINGCRGEVEMSYWERSRNVRLEPGRLDFDVSVAEPGWSRVRSGVQGRGDGLAPL